MPGYLRFRPDPPRFATTRPHPGENAGMRASALAVALSLVTFWGVPPAASGAPAGQVGIRLLDAPTGRANDPRARIYIVDHVAQGTTISRRIEVSSGLDHPARVAVYAAGASVSGGEFRFSDGHTQDEASTWTRVAPAAVDVPPGGASVATVTIAVPRGATSGERYAVVWAELPSTTSPTGVTTVNRVGIRIYLSVGRGTEPPSDFVVESLTASRDRQHRPRVSASVRNTGRRALDLSGELRLSNGPGGLSAGPFDVRLGTTLEIGHAEPVFVLLDPLLPDGPWDARLLLRSGLIVRVATGRIRFPSGRSQSSTPAPAVTRKVEPLHPERLFISGGGLLILLVGWFLFLFARRRRRDEERRDRGGK